MARRLLASFLLAACAAACSSPVNENELARRVRASRPTWQSYQEDVKGQIGAGPVAEWRGTVDEVRVEDGHIRVTFRVAGPWAARELAVPILLNEPLNGARREVSAIREGDRTTYLFDLPPEKSGLPVPWIELKFPGGQRRIALDTQGRWTAAK